MKSATGWFHWLCNTLQGGLWGMGCPWMGCVILAMACQPASRPPGSLGVGFAHHQIIDTSGQLMTYPVWYPAGKGILEENQIYRINDQLPAQQGRIAKEAPCRTGQRWPLIVWHEPHPHAAQQTLFEEIASQGAIVVLWQAPADLLDQALARQATDWFALLRQDGVLHGCIETSQTMLLLQGDYSLAGTYLRPMISKLKRPNLFPQALVLLYPPPAQSLGKMHLPILQITTHLAPTAPSTPYNAMHHGHVVTFNPYPLTTQQGALIFAKQLRQFYRHL